MKNPKNQVRLENIYVSSHAQASLYVIGEYGLMLGFSNPYFNDYNEIRLQRFKFFKYDPEELAETKKEDGVQPKNNIFIDESELKEFIELYENLGKDEKVLTWGLDSYITPYTDKIEVGLDCPENPLFEKALIEYFNENYRDRYYKNGIYPNISMLMLD